MSSQKRQLSHISAMHYFKLVFRGGLFLAAAVVYILDCQRSDNPLYDDISRWPVLFDIIWVVFVVEMILRFFPSRLESMGCQKQFARNYQPVNRPDAKPILQSWKATAAVAAAWLALNGAIGVLYFAGIIDKGILMLIALAYSVCDMICILFFCPFQMWFMKNRCCTTCRIYNWDFAMMFTPLLLIPHLYTWSLLAMSLGILARWEITLRLHPERFSETTNACLSCKNCDEKLCLHKRHILRLVKQVKHVKDTVKDTIKEKIKK